MRFLTTKQKLWMIKRTIKVDNFYMFPMFGFHIYPEANYLNSEYMDVNPFTKSLGHECFNVKEKVNGFFKGNFYHKPLIKDFYLSEDELSSRSFIEIFLIMSFALIPLVIFNLLRGGVSRIENKNN